MKKHITMEKILPLFHKQPEVAFWRVVWVLLTIMIFFFLIGLYIYLIDALIRA